MFTVTTIVSASGKNAQPAPIVTSSARLRSPAMLPGRSMRKRWRRARANDAPVRGHSADQACPKEPQAPERRRAPPGGGGALRIVHRGSRSAKLVLDDLGDSAHGAFFHAVAARDASVFVHNVRDATDDFEHFLRASIDADTAADALIGFNNRVSHVKLLLV